MGCKREDLAERLWPERLQELQDTLAECFGIPVLFVSASGRPLTACEDLSAFCRRLTRAIPFCRPCLDCGRADRMKQAAESKNAPGGACYSAIHLCPLGVTDVAIPIMCAGEVLGYAITGQVTVGRDGKGGAGRLHQETAKETEEHVALLARLPLRSRPELERVAAGLSVVASLVGALAAARRRNLHLADQVRSARKWVQAHTVTDAVTGIANQRYFYQAVRGELRRVRRYKRNVSVAVLEIEAFRRINDEFGHDVGDAILRGVGHCLTSTLRQTDLVGRIGGDEFGILFPETARHEAMIALSRVRTQVDELNASGELPVEVRFAVGIADEITEADEMIESAREAARRASSMGSLIA